jgi:ATP-dependent helicase Lhr and Lhr-like helicase
MSSSASSSSSSFGLLDERIQRWIWQEGWTALRDAQEQAVPALIEADRDVIIATATAAGKTEAAFLPILTHLLRSDPDMGSALYISPLKALINDQWGRLSQLCESLEIPVIPWHGDIAATRKHKFIKDARGILLITPESLEALFVTRGSSMPGLMAALKYLVVDELHAFIGAERGKQLQSLMARIERVAGKQVPRIGLSATLGDMGLAAEFLRPHASGNIQIIESKSDGYTLKVQIKGCVEQPPRVDSEPDLENPELEDLVDGSTLAIGEHLYKVLRGANNLVFPNSRRQVELYADLLRRRCERDNVPNEFWPHHGSLAKDIREEAEAALKEGQRPATAICTTTLELGIDIGAVKSIAQIGSPPSVASLRQRLGRSGRRKGEPAILRCYAVEAALDSKSDISDQLREGLVQSIAMVRLLIAGWFEPPRVGGLHASTLVQQILSIIAERGGATAPDLWATLIQRGAFGNVSREDFVALLRHLGEKELLIQESSGLLLHGVLGEKLVNHYEFYSAFLSDEEFRIVCDGRALGSLPVSRPLVIDQRIIFAGRRWRVLSVDDQKKLVMVAPDAGGAPPSFDGAGARVHDRVRQEMRVVLASNAEVAFIDSTAKDLLAEARTNFAALGLKSREVIPSGNSVLILTWHGDWINDALVLLLGRQHLQATNEGLAVRVIEHDPDRVLDALEEIGADEENDPVALLFGVQNLRQEKWDWALPDGLLERTFASSSLDIDGAKTLARKLAGSYSLG